MVRDLGFLHLLSGVQMYRLFQHLQQYFRNCTDFERHNVKALYDPGNAVYCGLRTAPEGL